MQTGTFGRKNSRRVSKGFSNIDEKYKKYVVEGKARHSSENRSAVQTHFNKDISSILNENSARDETHILGESLREEENQLKESRSQNVSRQQAGLGKVSSRVSKNNNNYGNGNGNGKWGKE